MHEAAEDTQAGLSPNSSGSPQGPRPQRVGKKLTLWVYVGLSASQVKVPDELTHPRVGTPFSPLTPPPATSSHCSHRRGSAVT